ncbi:MAG: hypothetical protein FJ137_01400 [Deltaproteobacteria bacterium]|nr:hypothetical protein [Deltaproteobacteria bacterium]
MTRWPSALACPTRATSGAPVARPPVTPDSDCTQNGVDPADLEPYAPVVDVLACPRGGEDNDGTLNDDDPDDVNACDPDPQSLACVGGSLANFCTGNGPPVNNDLNGDEQCAGQLAEQAFQNAPCACEPINDDGSQLNTDAFDSRRGAFNALLPGGGPTSCARATSGRTSCWRPPR